MIRYALKCSNDHGFDSWFASAAAFDRLAGGAMIACPVCGSADVAKSLMAPSVVAGDRPAAPCAAPMPADAPAAGIASRPLTEPQTPVEQAFAQLRRHIEANSEYVGRDFAAEARAIHDGNAPDRSIFGEAAIDEARALVEDGVPVAPLPFLPSRKTN